MSTEEEFIQLMIREFSDAIDGFYKDELPADVANTLLKDMKQRGFILTKWKTPLEARRGEEYLIHHMTGDVFTAVFVKDGFWRRTSNKQPVNEEHIATGSIVAIAEVPTPPKGGE